MVQIQITNVCAWRGVVWCAVRFHTVQHSVVYTRSMKITRLFIRVQSSLSVSIALSLFFHFFLLLFFLFPSLTHSLACIRTHFFLVYLTVSHLSPYIRVMLKQQQFFLSFFLHSIRCSETNKMLRHRHFCLFSRILC